VCAAEVKKKFRNLPKEKRDDDFQKYFLIRVNDDEFEWSRLQPVGVGCSENDHAQTKPRRLKPAPLELKDRRRRN
jgi:hypothetical protein